MEVIVARVYQCFQIKSTQLEKVFISLQKIAVLVCATTLTFPSEMLLTFTEDFGVTKLKHRSQGTQNFTTICYNSR